ncbi:MAG TPA: SCP2 sterol-binding domain-containing protein [Polyangiales bacterium]|jgi:hypothetical protein|nr:SCP2 sterol-binding domain-containing protein [Polyangiales bacterium]
MKTPIKTVVRQARGLQGLVGTVRVDIADRPTATIEIEGCEVVVKPGVDQADAVFRINSVEDLKLLLRGELNPFVASLQDRLEIYGDLKFGLQVILGLQVDPTFSERLLDQERS